MHQIFIPEIARCGQMIVPDARQLHHLSRVVRLLPSQQLRVVDGAGQAYVGVIRADQTIELVAESRESRELPQPLTLIAGLLKKDKWEWLLQKSTELGVSRIVPFESRRTVVKPDAERVDKQLLRWHTIIEQAAQQSQRTVLPELLAPLPLIQAAAYRSAVNLVGYEAVSHTAAPLAGLVPPRQSVSLVIGPEGGFEAEEIAGLEAAGYRCVSLGKRILRAETAAMFALSVTGAVWEAEEAQ